MSVARADTVRNVSLSYDWTVRSILAFRMKQFEYELRPLHETLLSLDLLEPFLDRRMCPADARGVLADLQIRDHQLQGVADIAMSWPVVRSIRCRAPLGMKPQLSIYLDPYTQQLRETHQPLVATLQTYLGEHSGVVYLINPQPNSPPARTDLVLYTRDAPQSADVPS